MNKTYLIVPVILLAVFGFLYSGATKDMEAKAAAQLATANARKATEDKRKAEIEARATLDAKARQEEREAADRAKEEKKIREYQDILKTLRDETAKFSAETDALSKESGQLENAITQARNEKEALNRETFALAKGVEQLKINRRNAELEIQRMVEMLGKKLSDSKIVVPPAPPPLPVAK